MTNYDPILRHGYGTQLEAAAKAFLINAFEQQGGVLGNGEPPTGPLVSAAMHIINGEAWTQPTDEQTKAAVFLSRNPNKPSGEED